MGRILITEGSINYAIYVTATAGGAFSYSLTPSQMSMFKAGTLQISVSAVTSSMSASTLNNLPFSVIDPLTHTVGAAATQTVTYAPTTIVLQTVGQTVTGSSLSDTLNTNGINPTGRIDLGGGYNQIVACGGTNFSAATISDALGRTGLILNSGSTPNLITNGTFANGLSGWSGYGWFPVSFGFFGFSTPPNLTHTAACTVWVGSNAPLAQTFSDVAGQIYTLSADIGSDGLGYSDVTFTINGVEKLMVGSPVPGGWNHYSFTFIGTGSDTLIIGGRQDPTALAVTNVSTGSGNTVMTNAQYQLFERAGPITLSGTATFSNSTVEFSDANNTNQTLDSKIGNWKLANGTNSFTLGAAGQSVTGGTGSDTLTGNASGGDTFNGGGGTDTFNFGTHSQADIIVLSGSAIWSANTSNSPTGEFTATGFNGNQDVVKISSATFHANTFANTSGVIAGSHIGVFASTSTALSTASASLAAGTFSSANGGIALVGTNAAGNTLDMYIIDGSASGSTVGADVIAGKATLVGHITLVGNTLTAADFIAIA